MKEEKKVYNLYTRQVVNNIKIDLIKVVYSDINKYSYDEIGSMSNVEIARILNQLKEFRIKYQYDYPKFILHSNLEQFKNCFDLLIAGCTLSEIEEYYFTYLAKGKVKVR